MGHIFADETTRGRVDRRQILKGAGALSAVGAIAALQIPTAVLANDDEGRRGVEGSWLETITVGGNLFPPFQALGTFAGGGGMVATASIDMAKGALSGPTHGAWVRTGARSFRWKAHAFSFADDGSGTNGTFFIDESLTRNKAGNAYTSSGSFKIVNNGTVIVSATFTGAATRITA